MCTVQVQVQAQVRVHSVTKTLYASIFPNRPALDQLNLIEKTSFRLAQLDQ